MARSPGWTVLAHDYAGVHVLPVLDGFSHELSWRCGCGPKLEGWVCDCCGHVKTQVVHEALDGRT